MIRLQRVHSLPLAIILLFFPFSSQGCVMHATEAEQTQQIQQILLKPAKGVPLDVQGRLSVDYMTSLQAMFIDSGTTEYAHLKLSYIRPMSMGIHVLGLEPFLQREAALSISQQLSERGDVEYAEPDFPRRRR